MVLKKLVFQHMPLLIAALPLEIMVECDQYLFFFYFYRRYMYGILEAN